MFLPSDLATITMRELSRSSRTVLDRVMHGERMIVCRYGHPIATLQPLNGCVTQPFEGKEYDVFGSPLGDVDRQIARLRPIEKKILMDGVRLDQFRLGRVAGGTGCPYKAVSEWPSLGLARKTRRGFILTGRALMLREVLLQRAGRADELYR